MEQSTQKKEWKSPELIVLVRSKPEEAVLTSCKNVSTPGDPVSSNDNCTTVVMCIECASLGSS